MRNYDEFLAHKRIVDPATGITSDIALPGFLFPHQADIVKWALRRGRAAIFAGTGLGKTAMELVWADHVARHTGKPSYFAQAVRNLAGLDKAKPADMFSPANDNAAATDAA